MKNMFLISALISCLIFSKQSLSFDCPDITAGNTTGFNYQELMILAPKKLYAYLNVSNLETEKNWVIFVAPVAVETGNLDDARNRGEEIIKKASPFGTDDIDELEEHYCTYNTGNDTQFITVYEIPEEILKKNVDLSSYIWKKIIKRKLTYKTPQNTN
jgi:hypothetical protein